MAVTEYVPTSTEALEFYAVDSQGTLHTREISRFMERTGPEWWVHTTGQERQAFWDAAHVSLIARCVVVRIAADGLRPEQPVDIEHRIIHGSRPRRGRSAEFGFFDQLVVRRHERDDVLAEFISHSAWLDMNSFQIADSPPTGLEVTDLPTPPDLPAPDLSSATQGQTFRWTPRESDVNRHVSLLSYFERAENAVADLGLPILATVPRTMTGWFLRAGFAGDAATALVTEGDDLMVDVLIRNPESTKAHAIVRFQAS